MLPVKSLSSGCMGILALLFAVVLTPAAAVAASLLAGVGVENTTADSPTQPIRYAPTADAHDKEGYEDALSQPAPEWEGVYEGKALELIRRLKD